MQVTSPFKSLQHVEAQERRALLDVTAYDVSLDLSAETDTFRSVTRIEFESRGGATFLDLKPRRVERVSEFAPRWLRVRLRSRSWRSRAQACCCERSSD